jgi:hypothetical protein
MRETAGRRIMAMAGRLTVVAGVPASVTARERTAKST